MAQILLTLKEKTAPQHLRTEQNRYAAAMLNRTMTLVQYRDYLARFYGFVLPLERQFAARPEWRELDFDITARLKSKLLEADLTALGLDKPAIDSLPLCPALPDVSTFARMLGCLYVLEGSTLGGQMQTKILMQYMPVVPDMNARYLNSYGTEVRARWAEFRELLSSQTQSESDERETVASAGETFDRLYDWIEASDGTASR